MKIGIVAPLAAGLLLAGLATAIASPNTQLVCGGNLNFQVETIPEDGRASIKTPRGTFFADAQSDGVYTNPTEQIQLDPNATPITLWLGSEQFNCQPQSQAQSQGGQDHASGAVGGNETYYDNLPGRSLGGRLRNGPGTNFSAAGSLNEGDQVSIVTNTGVRFDGYDWFEVRLPNGTTAYQWGGIMCSEDAHLPGIYAMCDPYQASTPLQSSSNASGFMAFAVGNNARFGHGAADTQQGAENTALDFCNDPSCRIDNVTTAQCHALATAPSGFWYGAADNKQQAESYAIGFCNGAGANCQISYSYCR